jgi:hypothetical protein
MNEWENEPNEEVFEHMGFKCSLHRGPLKAWCGYVGVPNGHPLYGKDYHEHIPALAALHAEAMNGGIGKRGIITLFCATPDKATMDISFDVHGGVTFAGKHKGGADLWHIGFDCSHAGDLTPGVSNFGDGEYRDISYVRDETKRLAEQIAMVK